MGTEGLKNVALFITNGNQITIVTRAPYEELIAQIKGDVTREGVDPENLVIIGISGPEEDPVEVSFQRHLICGHIIGKHYPAPPQRQQVQVPRMIQ